MIVVVGYVKIEFVIINFAAVGFVEIGIVSVDFPAVNFPVFSLDQTEFHVEILMELTLLLLVLIGYILLTLW